MIDGKIIDPNTDELYSGRVFVFFENKVNKKLEGFYRSGLKNSKWIWWNTNGRIDSTGSYRRGYMYGQWKWYYNNGQLFSKGYYRNGNGSDRKIEGVPRHGRVKQVAADAAVDVLADDDCERNARDGEPERGVRRNGDGKKCRENQNAQVLDTVAPRFAAQSKYRDLQYDCDERRQGKLNQDTESHKYDVQ